MSRLFTSGGQSSGASALASVLLMNIQGWFPKIDWFDLFAVQGTLKSLIQHCSLKASILWCTAFFMVQLSHQSWLLEKPYLWLYRSLTARWCLCFSIYCLGVIPLHPRNKHLLILWLQPLPTVILEPKGGKKICHFSLFCPFICHEVMEPVKGFGVVNKAKVDVFLELLLFQRSSECWQFDIWFLCLV